MSKFTKIMNAIDNEREKNISKVKVVRDFRIKS